MTDWTSLRYVVIDVEGNGQQPPDLVELALVPIVGGLMGTPQSWLVRPPHPISPMARRIHGISNQDVADAPMFVDISDDVASALRGSAVVAHNAGVDVAVLGRELSDWSASEVFDTLKLARRLLPGLASYRLGALVQAFDLAAGLPPGLTPHRAMYDALATAALFIRLAASVSLAELRTLAPKGDGDEAATLF